MPTPLETQVDTLINEFDEWFQKETGNEPIVRSERAILKTCFYWLTHKCDGVQLPGVVMPVQEKTDAQVDVSDSVQPL
jgi:hypothetical protein